jgi:hypothetical protein
VTAAAATSVTAENRRHRARIARTTVLVFHRRKCFLTNGLHLSQPVEKSWLFLSTGERAFITNGLFPSYLVETMVVFIHRRKCFLPMDYFLHYLVETMVVFIHRRKGFLPLDFLHYLVERMVVFIHRRKGFLPLDFLHYLVGRMGVFISTGERASYQWFYLHTSSNPEVNGRIRPENTESSANSVAAPILVN